MSDSNEFFQIIDGVKTDAALHAEILDNPVADDLLSEDAVKQALKDGIPLEEALDLYATDKVAAKFRARRKRGAKRD